METTINKPDAFIKTKNYEIRIIFIFLGFLTLGLNIIFYSFFNMEFSKTILRVVSIFFFLLSIFFRNKINYKELLIFIPSLYCIVIGASLGINLLFISLILMSIQEVNEKIIFKIIFIIDLIILLIVIVSLYEGLVTSTYTYYFERKRNNFGFSNVNVVGILLFSLCASFLMIMNKKNWYFIIPLIILFIYVFIQSDSRTSFFAFFAMILFVFYFKFVPKKIVMTTIYLFLLISFISPFLWKISIFQNTFLNDIMSNRPSIFLEFISNSSYFNLLFGGINNYEIDNFYLNLLYTVGLPIYLVIAIFTCISIKRLIKKNNFLMLAFCISLLIIGYTESSLLRPELLIVIPFWKNALSIENY